jgi:uncharacterized protein with GYD domain
MAKYMYQASDTLEGLKGLLRDSASGRKAAVESAMNAIGGKVEAFYYCFGTDDVVLLVDLSDNVKAASVALTVAASGMVHIRTTPLLTVDEADRALGGKVAYRPPGAAQ